MFKYFIMFLCSSALVLSGCAPSRLPNQDLSIGGGPHTPSMDNAELVDVGTIKRVHIIARTHSEYKQVTSHVAKGAVFGGVVGVGAGAMIAASSAAAATPVVTTVAASESFLGVPILSGGATFTEAAGAAMSPLAIIGGAALIGIGIGALIASSQPDRQYFKRGYLLCQIQTKSDKKELMYYSMQFSQYALPPGTPVAIYKKMLPKSMKAIYFVKPMIA